MASYCSGTVGRYCQSPQIVESLNQKVPLNIRSLSHFFMSVIEIETVTADLGFCKLCHFFILFLGLCARM